MADEVEEEYHLKESQVNGKTQTNNTLISKLNNKLLINKKKTFAWPSNHSIKKEKEKFQPVIWEQS